ncbi:MAG: aldo/keto reductase [Candidatus Aenigmatarchaeota archaeon]
MEYKTLMDNVKIPVLGIGTWKLVGDVFPDKSQDKKAIKILREGIRLGMSHIDTAEIYANGHAEEITGKAIRPFKRKDIFITTKVSPENLRFDDLIDSIRNSLKRLNLNFVDLYLIHWPNPNIPLKETMEAMEYAVDCGYTRFIGVSNFSVRLMRKAQSYTKKKIVANQVEYSLLYKDPQRDLLSYCQKNGIMLIAYTPLGHGKLTKPGFKLLDELALKYKKTQAQIALNWLISKRNVVTIPKTGKIEHLRENFGAMGWRLTHTDIERLDKERFRLPYNSVRNLKRNALYFVQSHLWTNRLIMKSILPAVRKLYKRNIHIL